MVTPISSTRRLLSVRSDPASGTHFEIYMPCTNLDAVPMVSGTTGLTDSEAQPASPVHHVLHGSILLVEDNQENQALLSLILSKMGATVTTADNGQDAIAKATNARFDLIYMDMQMPLVSGLEATEALRGQGYTGAIIALTANATSEDRAACLQAGCDDFLTKPINRDKLYETTARYLRGQDRNDEAAPIYSQLDDDDPVIQDLLLRFVQGLPQTIARLDQLYRQQDWRGFKKQIHDLKGTGGNFGYATLTSLSEKIETEVKRENWQAVARLYEELNYLADRIYSGVFPKVVNSVLKMG